MNYIGIALTSYDINICKVIADKLADKKGVHQKLWYAL